MGMKLNETTYGEHFWLFDDYLDQVSRGAVVAIYRFLKNPSNVGIRLHEIVTGLTVGRLTGDLPIEWLFRSRLPEAADVDIN